METLAGNGFSGICGFESTKPLSSLSNTQLFSQTGKMIELCCECLSAWCIWLSVLIISHTCFRVNLHSVLAGKTGAISES